jgi:hypothetical protein
MATIPNPLDGTPVAGQLLCAPVSYAPASRVTYATSSPTLSAIGSSVINTGTFTVPPSGNVLVTVSLVAAASASGRAAFSVAAHGTVSPVLAASPVFGLSAASVAFSAQMLVTGLTPGESSALDVLYSSVDGETVDVYAISNAGTSPGSTGGPVVITVQAA